MNFNFVFLSLCALFLVTSSCSEKDHEKQARLEEEARLKKIEALRTKARAEAVGLEMQELTISSGRIFENVEIRAASPIGLTIRHTHGSARIPYAELPEKMQKRFFYDPEEAKRALKDEQKRREAYEKKAQTHLKIKTEKTREQHASTTESRKRILRDKIAMANASLSLLQSKLSRLNSDLSNDQGQAYDRRLYRRTGVSRAPQIREEIGDTESEILRLKRYIISLQSQLKAL